MQMKVKGSIIQHGSWLQARIVLWKPWRERLEISRAT